jgi:hypothetical protein
MSKKEPIVDPKTKWERIIEDDKSFAIWRYDLNYSKYNPTEVEIFYKDDKIDLKEINKYKKKV